MITTVWITPFISDDALNFLSVEFLTFDEGLSERMQDMDIRRQDGFGGFIAVSDHEFNFFINGDGWHFAVVFVLRYLATQKDLLIFLSK